MSSKHPAHVKTKHHEASASTPPVASAAKRRTYRWSRLVLYPAWVLAAFFAAQFIIAGILAILKFLQSPILQLVNPTVLELVLATVIYTLALVITFGLPYLVRRHPISLTTLGLTRLPTWTDIGLAPLGFVAYALGITGVLYVVTTLLPGFPLDQEQDVGFQSMGTQFEYLIGFIALVVLAPIAEEVLFRGYLYGRLLANVPRLPAILVVSALFGAVHGQWNVIIDTFVLSVVMCLLRDLTGNIWAGILLHMIKNAVAFHLLFVAPVYMGALL